MNDYSLSSLRLDVFTERLSSSAPFPGGGGTAALAGALAASLASMAVNLSLGKKKYLCYQEDHRKMLSETEALRLRFLALMGEDAAAFEPLSRLYAEDPNTPGHTEALRTATLNACQAPLRMMACCSELISLLETLPEKCSPLLLSDVGCAALNAGAALKAAAMNVYVNTRLLPGDAEAAGLATQADALLSRDFLRAQAVADSVMTYLKTPKKIVDI